MGKSKKKKKRGRKKKLLGYEGEFLVTIQTAEKQCCCEVYKYTNKTKEEKNTLGEKSMLLSWSKKIKKQQTDLEQFSHIKQTLG